MQAQAALNVADARLGAQDGLRQIVREGLKGATAEHAHRQAGDLAAQSDYQTLLGQIPKWREQLEPHFVDNRDEMGRKFAELTAFTQRIIAAQAVAAPAEPTHATVLVRLKDTVATIGASPAQQQRAQRAHPSAWMSSADFERILTEHRLRDKIESGYFQTAAAARIPLGADLSPGQLVALRAPVDRVVWIAEVLRLLTSAADEAELNRLGAAHPAVTTDSNAASHVQLHWFRCALGDADPKWTDAAFTKLRPAQLCDTVQPRASVLYTDVRLTKQGHVFGKDSERILTLLSELPKE